MRAWIWMKCCVSTDAGTWTNWLTFEPDPDIVRMLEPDCFLRYRICAGMRNFITSGKSHVCVGKTNVSNLFFYPTVKKILKICFDRRTDRQTDGHRTHLLHAEQKHFYVFVSYLRLRLHWLCIRGRCSYRPTGTPTVPYLYLQYSSELGCNESQCYHCNTETERYNKYTR